MVPEAAKLERSIAWVSVVIWDMVGLREEIGFCAGVGGFLGPTLVCSASIAGNLGKFFCSFRYSFFWCYLLPIRARSLVSADISNTPVKFEVPVFAVEVLVVTSPGFVGASFYYCGCCYTCACRGEG